MQTLGEGADQMEGGGPYVLNWATASRLQLRAEMGPPHYLRTLG